ncbi:MAG: sulfite exporter TauE/SafE family protein [Chloroflexi bacterium]|nr:sulfite exporter TauE/SafE family protein [Chloroflexota bacterium]
MRSIHVPRRVWRPVLVGAAAGGLAGLMGVGGGIVLVPLLVALLGVEQHPAHATSLAVIPAIAVFGALPYIFQNYMRWDLALYMALGSSLGVIAGARMMPRIPAPLLRRLFSLLVIGIGVRFLLVGA